MTARICVLTAGQLSTCPRMLKAADALADAGYHVRLVSARHTAWADDADRDVLRRRPQAWSWASVDYRRDGAVGTYAWSGTRRRAAEAAGRVIGPGRLPVPWAARAYSRAHTELVAAALAEPADLFYGGTTGALAATAEAGRRAGVPYALDLEDFHGAEHEPGPAADVAHALAERILRAVLPGARFLTTSSAAIAQVYAARHGVDPAVVHNVFPLPAEPPDTTPTSGEGLRLYWFSQTIGPGRGLEEAIRAAGAAAIPVELHLRGRAIPDYVGRLESFAQETAPRAKLILHEPAPPDTMVALCAGYDVGLAVESPRVLNRSLCVTNKVFTYMLAGLAVALTDTPGQHGLAAELGSGAIVYAAGDVEALAAGLRRWAGDKPVLAGARAAAWRAAQRRWHWAHPEERGVLVDAVARALS